jgi:hypothetical protein
MTMLLELILRVQGYTFIFVLIVMFTRGILVVSFMCKRNSTTNNHLLSFIAAAGGAAGVGQLEVEAESSSTFRPPLQTEATDTTRTRHSPSIHDVDHFGHFCAIARANPGPHGAHRVPANILRIHGHAYISPQRSLLPAL